MKKSPQACHPKGDRTESSSSCTSTSIGSRGMLGVVSPSLKRADSQMRVGAGAGAEAEAAAEAFIEDKFAKSGKRSPRRLPPVEVVVFLEEVEEAECPSCLPLQLYLPSSFFSP